ncbi:MAG TPA: cytochrome b/b6 domain-containing protein, partial [Campylobacterales bacterium]|nr:cytochrome b/b6 domain-containing protein [Campylobacterales bacterium]
MDTKKHTKRPVWDLPTRIFHWGLAFSVFLSMLIVYGRWYLTLHIVSGSIAFALIIGRIVWGFVGSRYVRFSAFVKGIDEAKKEFTLIRDDEYSHSVGHPAIAGWVMLLLMFCAFSVGVSGVWLWQFTDAFDKESVLYWHEIFANTLLAIAFIHIQGVILHIFLHRDGIVMGMIDGRRPA